MERWALMHGDVIANVVEQDDQPQIEGQWVACGDAGPGWHWDGEQFSPPAPLTWASTDLDPRYWWIDKGPFFDRFGSKALTIVSSADPLVQGLVSLIMPRAYIDLRRPDIPSLLDVMVGKSLITAAEKAAVLTAPTTDYERHIKGLPQPGGA